MEAAGLQLAGELHGVARALDVRDPLGLGVGGHIVDRREVEEMIDTALQPRHVLVGDVVLGTLLLLLAGRLGRGVADHRTLLVAAGDVRDNASCQRTLHELVEPVAVALLEGRSLRLPVIGEDDDLVRPRCEGAGALDPTELLVELAQRLERVRPLES